MKVAILGYGTVGGGVATVLEQNEKKIAQYLGEDMTLAHILDLRTFPGDRNEDLVTDDFEKILADESVRVICEAMGGLHPAYEFTKKALDKGISVCTSNKELVSTHGPELVQLAKDRHCSYLFEASVGGGIPLLRPFSTTLMHERITRVTGVLNGTTNYILTRMEEGDAFETALLRAQQKGYAEKDPTADIEGIDACRKTAILASLAGGAYVSPDEIPTEGITGITSVDFDYARTNGYAIRLIGQVTLTGGATGALVAPFLVPEEHPLAGVHDVFNACIVHGNMLGNVMFFGPGAGDKATASAVVSDMLDAALHDGSHVFVNLTNVPALRMDDEAMMNRFFVRVDETAKNAAVRAFGEDITFMEARSVRGEWAFITPKISEQAFRDALHSLDEVRGYLRVLK